MRRARRFDPRERAAGDRIAQRRLGDLGERALVGQRLDGGEASVFVDALERIERDVAQHRQRRVADRRVGVIARDGGQRLGIEQLADGRLPDARVAVLARRGHDLVAFGQRQLGEIREADGRVGVPLRLRAEAIEKRHEMPSCVNRAATSRPCDAARTCVSMSRMRPSAPM